MLKDATSFAAIEQSAASGQPVVLHYWASWCEPCKHMDKVMAQLASEYPQATFMRVEAEEVDQATIKHEITTVPSFIFIKGGAIVDRLEGADAPALTAKTAAAAGNQGASNGPPAAAAPAAGAAAGAATGAGSVEGRIKWLLSENPILLFMKGVPDAPRCGFSSKVVDALRIHNVPFKAVDILADQELRDGVKVFSNWPTYPQLYVKGELVGGCDIVLEMQKSGELGQALKAVQRAPDAAAAAPPVPLASQPVAPAPAANGGTGESLEGRLKALVHQQPVMLFMKGNPTEPRCGFSRKVVDALQSISVPFGSFDILQDQAVREGMKVYSNWPTFPQLYIKGELLGGCDIVLQMQEAGELKSTITDMMA